MRTINHSLAGQERGIVLVVALVMLVLITIIGMTSIRTLTLEERMASNTYDRNLAFQAAETALREGEALANTQSLNINGPNGAFPGAIQTTACATTHCANGLCNLPNPVCGEVWLSLTGANDWRNATTPNTALAGNNPQYIVEYLGNTFPCNPQDITSIANCKRYRITARAEPGDGRAMVMLQSLFAAE